MYMLPAQQLHSIFMRLVLPANAVPPETDIVNDVFVLVLLFA